MGIASRFFRWHRWLGYLVALQVLLWVAGGVVFAWLPFQGWVKAQDGVRKPELELPAGRAVWVAAFDDALGTRLSADARSGELLAARNEAWVWYDFFCRLHVMGYAEGEDFNNPLLRAAAPVVLALALVLTGAVLLVLALRRAWRRR